MIGYDAGKWSYVYAYVYISFDACFDDLLRMVFVYSLRGP